MQTDSVLSLDRPTHRYISKGFRTTWTQFYKDEETTNQQHKQVYKQLKLWGLSWRQQRQLHIEMKTKAGVISYKWMGWCLRSLCVWWTVSVLSCEGSVIKDKKQRAKSTCGRYALWVECDSWVFLYLVLLLLEHFSVFVRLCVFCSV